MTSDTQMISLEDAQALLYRAFEANGVIAITAASVAAALVAAEAEGQVGHGFSRLADYVAQVRSGKIVANVVPQITPNGKAALSVDAQNGFAYPALDMAIDRGVIAAREYGCATMAITRSHHCGALSVQVEKIARQGLIGLMVANAPAAIAPFGSKQPMFGTNPIAFAAPRIGASPLVIDLSLSRVARGKVMHAKKTGQSIPQGWALDRDGNSTTDPEAALQGSMVAIGEAKGTALALMVEVLSAVLTGAHFSTEVSSYFTADGPPPGSGQFLMVLRPDNSNGFAVRLEALLSQIAGADGARLPGERRMQALEQAKIKGIEVPVSYLDIARKLGASHG